MIEQKQLAAAFGVSAPAAVVAWFAETLPMLQWGAAAVAITVGLHALYRYYRPRK